MTTTSTTPASAPPTPVYRFADLRKRQQVFVDALINAGYSGTHTTRRAVVATAAVLGYPDSFPWPSWLTADMARRSARGVFSLPELAERVRERAGMGSLPTGYTHDPAVPGTMRATTPSASA